MLLLSPLKRHRALLFNMQDEIYIVYYLCILYDLTMFPF